MPRLTFYQLFRLIDSNTLELLRRTRIGAIEFNPGETIAKGTIVAGIDFFNYIDAEIEADNESGVWVVRRVYGRSRS